MFKGLNFNELGEFLHSYTKISFEPLHSPSLGNFSFSHNMRVVKKFEWHENLNVTGLAV